MSRPVGLVFVLVAAVFAGCLQDSDPLDGLRAAFGDAAIDPNNHTVTAHVLEGQLQGGAEWTKSTNVSVDVPKITIPKSDPGPQGGGGTTQALEIPSSSQTVSVRFVQAGKLAGYDAAWGTTRDPKSLPDWSSPQDATQSFSASVSGPGPVFVAAQFIKDGKVVATVVQPYVAIVSVHWTIESAVRPMRAQDPAPPPDNYDAMSDKFTIDLDSANVTVLAETKYRGTYVPSSGTDVDLEVDPPGGKTVCSGTGGASSPAPVDPEQSKEKVLISGLNAGSLRILVGAGDEAKCATTFFYNNAGMVPYTLDVTLSY